MIESASWWVDRAFLYVGRLDPSKGVDVILRAYAGLATTSASLPPLWVAGGVPVEMERLRARLPKVVEDLESRKLLVWWGFQRPATIAGLLSRALALVMHSQYEPGGRVVVEALAAGVPVIATPTGFARELVRDWTSGFLVEYGDADTLKLRLDHFARQPLLRAAMSDGARRAAMQVLNTWRFVDTHCEVYDDVVMHACRRGSPTEVVPECPPNDILHQRSFAPTYPWSPPPADDAYVEIFIRAYDGVMRVRERHGRLWSVARGNDQFVVKQVDGRFTACRLWNRRADTPLLDSAKDRFLRDVASGQIDGYVPVLASDPDRHLVLRPAGAPVAITAESVVECVAALQHVRAERPQIATSVPVRTGDVRNRWRFVRRNLSDSAHPLLGGLVIDWTAVDALASMADEAQRVLSHGAPYFSHFVRYQGAVRLISGGSLEIAPQGKDAGRLLLDLLATLGEWIAEPFFTACPSDERRETLAWAALLSLEGICRNALLQRGTRMQYYLGAWQRVHEIGRLIP